MKVCKICLNELTVDELDNLFSYIHPSLDICSTCLSSLKIVFKTFSFLGVEATYIYEYDDKIRNLLFLFKGRGDYALKDIFIEPVKRELKEKFKGYVIVPIPSSKNHEKERGFSHVKEMFELLGLPYLEILEKREEIKQSSLSRKKRWENRTNIVYNGHRIKENLKILLVDDVMTTGATLTASIQIVKKFKPKIIKILLMSKNVKKRR